MRTTSKLIFLVTGALSLAQFSLAFPSYASLAGLDDDQLAHIIPRLHYSPPPTPPGPLNDTSTKLVNDASHAWKAPGQGDQRGPCPGLNTLANHGYLPRNGIATPTQIINAVQEGFNMDNTLAILVTYAAHLVDGNLITDKMSIGAKSPLTGAPPPSPAIVGGLDTHGTFEGDASLTRNDFYFGNNHDFNEALFDQMVEYSNKFGAGNYNLTVAGELRFKRIQDSIATNPTFSFVAPRYFTAYGEAAFPVDFFVDGRKGDGQLDMKTARSFFQYGRMPDGFFRANGSQAGDGTDVIINAHPVQPGRNVGGRVNNYVVDPTSADFNTPCLLYTNYVNQTVKALYPNPTGPLLSSLKQNLHYFFLGFAGGQCEEIFPYGK